MDKVKIYTAYSPPPKVVMKKFGDSLTRQSEAASCNINKIMEKYEKTGVLPVMKREEFFADVSSMGDYRQALSQVQMADEAFMELPAKLRARFENDAAMFLDFCSDIANREEMVELGLLEDVSGAVPVVPEVPAEGAESVGTVPA